jgi:hypothetical protein
MLNKITYTRELKKIYGFYGIYNKKEYKIKLEGGKKIRLLYRITTDPISDGKKFCDCEKNKNWIFPEIVEVQVLEKLFQRSIYIYYKGYKGYFAGETENEVWVTFAGIPDTEVDKLNFDRTYDRGLYYEKKLQKKDHDFYIEERQYEFQKIPQTTSSFNSTQ